MTFKAARCGCGGDSTVTDSRETRTWVARRRKCLECGARWSTREVRVQSTMDRRERDLVDKLVLERLESLVCDLKKRML